MTLQNRFRSLEPCAAAAMHFEVPSSMHPALPFFGLITRPLQKRHVAAVLLQLMIPRLSGRDYSYIIEARSVECYPILNVTTMKMLENCLPP